MKIRTAADGRTTVDRDDDLYLTNNNQSIYFLFLLLSNINGVRITSYYCRRHVLANNAFRYRLQNSK